MTKIIRSRDEALQQEIRMEAAKARYNIRYKYGLFLRSLTFCCCWWQRWKGSYSCQNRFMFVFVLCYKPLVQFPLYQWWNRFQRSCLQEINLIGNIRVATDKKCLFVCVLIFYERIFFKFEMNQGDRWYHVGYGWDDTSFRKLTCCWFWKAKKK